MTKERDANSWIEYRRLVLYELENISGQMEKIHSRLNTLDRTIANLKGQAFAIGSIGAILTTVFLNLIVRMVG